jgi:hypothetical protein
MPVSTMGQQRRQRCQLPDRPVQTSAFRGGKREPGASQRPSHDDADVQARHCQQMREPRGAESVMIRRRNAGRDPGQQGDRDGARRTRHNRRDMAGDGLAQPLHRAQHTAWRRCRQAFRVAQCIP